jgi:hypothetical protein
VRFFVRFFITCALCATVFCALHLPAATAANQIMLGPVKKPLTNQDVVQMVKAKFADSTIVKVIQANNSNFDLSVPALVALKTVGASQQVIEEMLSAGTSKKEARTTALTTPPSPPPPTNPPPAAPVAVPARAPARSKPTDLPDKVGMYLSDDFVKAAIEAVHAIDGTVQLTKETRQHADEAMERVSVVKDLEMGESIRKMENTAFFWLSIYRGKVDNHRTRVDTAIWRGEEVTSLVLDQYKCSTGVVDALRSRTLNSLPESCK